MPTKNQGRMAQDMKRELIDIISHMKDPRVTGGLLTVTRLDVTPDLDVAKVHVSVMGREGGEAEVIKGLNRAAGHVRTEISRRMHIRKAPRFVFVADDGAAYAAHINALLKQLDGAAPAEETPDADATGPRGGNAAAPRPQAPRTQKRGTHYDRICGSSDRCHTAACRR